MSTTSTRHEVIRKRREDHFAARPVENGGLGLLPLAVIAITAVSVLAAAIHLVSRPAADGSFLSSVTPEALLGGFVEVAAEMGGSSFGGADLAVTAPSPTASARPTAEPTPTPQPTVGISEVTGSPYSAASVVSAWEDAGLKVTQKPVEHTGFKALAGNALRIDLDSGRGATSVALLAYADSGAVSTDWHLQSGQKPRLKSGHAMPDNASVWWNSNLVIVVLDRGGSSAAAFEAFFRVR